MNAVLQNEPVIRLTVFLSVLAAMALFELAAPRRRLEIPRILRWSNNLGLVVIDTIVVRLCFPVAAVGMAIIATQNGWGLFNLVDLPTWMVVLLSLILLDLAIYGQHVVFHVVPFLWRLHRVHHADQDFDVTTGLRFHPLEILVSMAIKLAVVLLLGVPAVAVLVFEIVLNATAMFNHANIRIPISVDRALRLLIVTPDMHRVHHSARPKETNSNFGFNLSWWDRLLGTYQSQPEDGHDKMRIGLAHFRTRRELWLDRMLMQPFHHSGNVDSSRVFYRVIVAVCISAVAGWLALNCDALDVSAIEITIRGLGGWAAPAHVLAFAAASVLFLPGAIFGLIGGAVFGPFWGALFNLLGASLGAVFSFLIARFVAADWVRRRAGSRLDRLITGVEAEGWRFVAFTRLVPLFPFNLLNYAFGLTRIPLLPYAGASLICMIPGTFAVTWLGHAGREAVSGDIAAIKYATLSLAILAIIAFLPRLILRLRLTRAAHWISVEELSQRILSENAPIIIDVREPDEFIGPMGSIPGSRNIPLGRLIGRIPESEKDRPIVLVCLTDKRSAKGAKLLNEAGFGEIIIVRGGMKQWCTQTSLPTA